MQNGAMTNARDARSGIPGGTENKYSFDPAPIGKGMDSLALPFFITKAGDSMVVYANDAARARGILPGINRHAAVPEGENPSPAANDHSSDVAAIDDSSLLSASARPGNDANGASPAAYRLPIRDDSGRVSHVAEFMFDAIDRSRTAEIGPTPGATVVSLDGEMKSADDEAGSFRHRMEFIPGVTRTGLDIIDADFNIRYIDPSWQETLGDPTGKKCYQYFMSQSKPCPQCGVVRALETKSIVIGEGVLRRDRIVQITSIPFQDNDGEWLVADVHTDVTERQNAETALKESEERYRIIAEQTGRLIYDHDLRSGRVNWSGAITRVTGYEEAEFRDVDVEGWIELIHPDDRKQALMALVPVSEGISPYHCEYRFRVADGSYRHIEDNGVSMKNDEGTVVRILGTMFDITDRKSAEQAKAANQKYLQNIVDYINDPVFVKDEQHRLVMVNEAFCTLSGLSRDQVIGKRDADLYPEQQARVFVEHDNNVFSSMGADENEESITGAGGDIRTISTKKAAFINPVTGGKTLVGVIRDITERKRAEAALQESEERYRTLYESSRDAIVQISSSDGNFCGANPAAVELYGCRDEAELRLCSPAALSPEYQPDGSRSETKAREIMDRAFREGSAFFEWLHKRTDGTLFPATVLITRMTIGGQAVLQATVRDETRRKSAEQALRESETRFRTIVNAARDAIVVMGSKGEVNLWSPGAEATFGWTAEEAVGESVHDLLAPPRMREGFNKTFAAFQTSGCGAAIGRTMELPALHKDGHEFPVELSLSSLELDGKWHAVGILRDITERKQMEKEIAYRLKIEESLATASRMVQDPTSTDMDKLLEILGTSIGVNHAGIFRITDDRSRMNCVHKWSPRDQQLQIDAWQDLDPAEIPWAYATLMKGNPVVVSDTRDLMPDAAAERAIFQQRNVGSALLIPISSSTHDLVGFIGFGQRTAPRHWRLENIQALQIVGEMVGNAWDRQAAEETLRQTVARYTAMIDTVPALMYIKNTEHRYTVVNAAFRRATKKTDDKIVGHDDRELFPREAAEWLFETGKSAMEGNGAPAVNQEKHIDLGDGAIRWLAATVVPLSDHASIANGVVGMVQDVTETHLNRDQLIQTDKLAAIGTLAAGVAHEINNPMGFISSNLNTMGKYLKKIEAFMAAPQVNPDDRETERKALQEMFTDFADAISESLEGANRVKKIVADLKSFSRIDRAEKEMANLNDGLESTLNIVWNELKYNCTVEKNYGEIPEVYCIPNQINQVFMNLLVNAGQAITQPPGIITISTWADDTNICVSIKDNGCGIPEENLHKIFEPFFTTKEVGKGTGLGLGLAYEIVKKHGGNISVSSKVGVGTEFVISIPREGFHG